MSNWINAQLNHLFECGWHLLQLLHIQAGFHSSALTNPPLESVAAVVCAIMGGLTKAFPECGTVLKLPSAIRGARAKVLVTAVQAITDTGVLGFCAYLKICFVGTRDLLRIRSEGRACDVLALNPQGEV